jgi:VWFA-related protein
MNHKTLIILLSLALMTVSASAQATPNSGDPEHLAIPLVLNAARDGSVPTLKAGDIGVTRKGVAQSIEYVRGPEELMNLLIIIDTRPYDAKVSSDLRDAAMRMIDRLGKNDQASVISFDKKVRVLSEWSSEKGKLRRAVNRAEPIVIPMVEGTTMISHDAADLLGPNDGLAIALQDHMANAKGRKAIVLVTHANGRGKVSDRTVQKALAGADVVVYPVFFPSPTLYHVLMMHGMGDAAKEYGTKNSITMDQLIKLPPVNYLDSLATATGGRLFAADRTDFDAAFKQISDELSRQFVIGVKGNPAASAEPADTVLTINRPDLSARTKSSIRITQPAAN